MRRSPRTCARSEQYQRHRDFATQTAPGLDGTRAAVSARACTGADQDYFSQRYAVPGNLFQVRRYRRCLRDPYALLDAITGIMAEDIHP